MAGIRRASGADIVCAAYALRDRAALPGANPKCRPAPKLSAYRGRPEVVGAQGAIDPHETFGSALPASAFNFSGV